MCLILFSYQQNPRYPLIVAANRDEFYERPTAPAHFWEDSPSVLAGRDLKAGGTWLGVTRSGRFAALTNYREPGHNRPDAVSRGDLVADFLAGSDTPDAYAHQVHARGERFNGFNLLVADVNELWYVSNRGGRPHALSPGLYGLSNHLLNTPWPKVERGKVWLADATRSPLIAPEPIFRQLADTSEAPDEDLPATGVPLEVERMLSSTCIVSSNYGTRASTLVMFNAGGTLSFRERSFAVGATVAGTVEYNDIIVTSESFATTQQ